MLTVVGGAAEGSVSGDASPCCVGLLREKDAWLFDAGEDTQRQLMWLEHIRPSKVRQQLAKGVQAYLPVKHHR